MKLEFIPGALVLTDTDGLYVITVRGEEVYSSTVMKRAVAKFNEIRNSLAKEHPTAEATAEERAALLHKEIGEALVDENHYGPQKLKKGRRSSRTFG